MKKPYTTGVPNPGASAPPRKDAVPPPKPQEPTVGVGQQVPWPPATPPAKMPFKV